MTPEVLVTAAVGLAGAVVGALGAMGGSWLQSRHDRGQRERERVMALRRDVYLEAAEGLAGFPHYLVGLANADVPVASLEPLLNAKRGWQNKLHVIASLETIAAFAKADALFIETSFHLFPLRHKVDELGSQAEEEARQRSQLTQYQAALHTALQAEVHHGQGQENIAAVQAMRAAIDRSQEEIVASYEREAALHGERAERIKELLGLALTKVAEHRLLLGEANLAVRREIEAPVDDERYLEMMREMNDQALGAFEAFFQSLDPADERLATSQVSAPDGCVAGEEQQR